MADRLARGCRPRDTADVPRVTFDGAGRTTTATRGTNLLAVVRRAGLPIARACGGRGICDSCWLRVDDGLEHLEQLPAPGTHAGIALEPGWVMACLARIDPGASDDASVVLWSPAWGRDPRSGS